MAIITRAGKGSELTHAEMDANLVELETHPNGLKMPDTVGAGTKLGSGETYGWHDLRANFIRGDANVPAFAAFIGGVGAFQFVDGSSEELFANFHIPHDYVPGTDIFIHVHWLHDAATVTGGTVTWGFEATYAKGHQQAPFTAPVLVPVTQAADTTQYMHMVAETALTVSGGSANQLDTDLMEVDGVISTRLYLDSNDITVSGGGVPNPFAFFVDLHYQSSDMPTLNRAPSFYGA